MFTTESIENDLKIVDDAIREFYQEEWLFLALYSKLMPLIRMLVSPVINIVHDCTQRKDY
jgi:hypothetical protein